TWCPLGGPWRLPPLAPGLRARDSQPYYTPYPMRLRPTADTRHVDGVPRGGRQGTLALQPAVPRRRAQGLAARSARALAARDSVIRRSYHRAAHSASRTFTRGDTGNESRIHRT